MSVNRKVTVRDGSACIVNRGDKHVYCRAGSDVERTLAPPAAPDGHEPERLDLDRFGYQARVSYSGCAIAAIAASAWRSSVLPCLTHRAARAKRASLAHALQRCRPLRFRLRQGL